MIRIVLVEDHSVVRSGLSFLLKGEKDFRVTGEASNGMEALRLLETSVEADVLLTDINMPFMNGLELTRKVREKYPTIKTLILSMLEHEKYLIEAFDSGACGYALKNIDAQELVCGLRMVSQDRRFICAELASTLFDKVTRFYEKESESIRAVSADLSPREMEVLGLIADGFTNQEIADKLFTSKRTVEGHRLSLIDKTETRNTASLIQYAFRAGLLK
ncbi:response regulator [Pedobacter sp. HMF7647]|uniref:Response regulator n=1 Tax=Hufsiella arboris TaxID=2695275 RepID=A0A7K1YF53_9SPHI|nr:response regulator transcription factor [Hufsiella arboris]MXV53233.1 response regulator [Hufsiella arboris]